MRAMTNRIMLAVAVAAVVVLAACGSSSKASVASGAQPSTASSTTAPTPTTKATAATAAVVMTGTSSTMGAILVDSKGMTLYTLTNAGAPVACTGQCATFWPPLLLPAGTVTAMGATGVSGLGTASTSGGLQVTHSGDPLYRFSVDKAPGDTKGEGISSFGGTWHVVKATAGTAAPATVAPATVAPVVTSPPAGAAPTTTNPYGY
jgi:predicted lipoprotein with Yx(FWY)xxD motif